MNRKEPPAKSEAVRKAMQGNTKKDTSIEIILRRALFKRGVRYRKNVKSILGTPDIAKDGYDSCFPNVTVSSSNLSLKTDTVSFMVSSE